MNEIIDFLRGVPAFHIATCTADGRPKVRPFSLVFEYGGKLTFGTNTKKSIYRELAGNPFTEICAYDDKSGNWLRVGGRVEFIADIEAKRKVFETMPALKALYTDENNPELVCFSITEGEAAVFSLADMYTPSKTYKL